MQAAATHSPYGTVADIERRKHAAETYLKWLESPQAQRKDSESEAQLAQRKMKLFAALLGVDLSSPQHSLRIQHEVGLGLRELVAQYYTAVNNNLNAPEKDKASAIAGLAALSETPAQTGEHRFALASDHETAKAAELMGFVVTHVLDDNGQAKNSTNPVSFSNGDKTYQSVRSGTTDANLHYELERTTAPTQSPAMEGVISGNGNCAINLVARAMADAVGCPQVTSLNTRESGEYIAGKLPVSGVTSALELDNIKKNLIAAFDGNEAKAKIYLKESGLTEDLDQFAKQQAEISSRVFHAAALKQAGATLPAEATHS